MSRRNDGPDSLTLREKEVLQLIAAGLSSKEIAQALGIKFKTVVCHRTRVLQKLDMHGTADLTRYAMRHGLVNADVPQEERLRQHLRASHRAYMEAVTDWNKFVAHQESTGMAHPDGSERIRQLRMLERREWYTEALRAWTDFVLGPKNGRQAGRARAARRCSESSRHAYSPDVSSTRYQ